MIGSKRWLLPKAAALALALLIFHWASCLPAAAGEDVATALRSFWDEYTTIGQQGAGVVVGLVDDRGTRVFSYGKMASEGKAVDGDTVFEIGSITKTFTTLLLQDMVARGEMKLDDPAEKYLPEAIKMPTRGGKQITLFHLAAQTSGFPFNSDDLKQTAEPGENPFEGYTVEKLYDYLARHELQHDPGTDWGYSNLGMGLLGHLIERKADASYEALLVDRICKPLGMQSTRVALPPELAARLATGHNPAGKPAPNWDIGVLVGTGGIRSTVNDMLKYVAAQVGLNQSDLTPLMQRTHEIHRRDVLGWGNTAMPWFDLGVYQTPDMQLLGHSGGTGGYSNFVGFDKKRRRGVVLLSNQTTFSSSTFGWILLQSRWHEDDRPTAVKLDGAALDACVGQYQAQGCPVLGITRKGDRLIMNGQFNGELLGESDADFFSRISGVRLVKFTRDNAGHVTGLVLTRYGTRYDEAKISAEPPQTVAKNQQPVGPGEAKALDGYTGRYELAPDDAFEITRAGDKLSGHRAGQVDFELEPRAGENFYIVLGAHLNFVRDERGKVSEAILRPLFGPDRRAKKLVPATG